jgi:hypothetical protein
MAALSGVAVVYFVFTCNSLGCFSALGWALPSVKDSGYSTNESMFSVLLLA